MISPITKKMFVDSIEEVRLKLQVEEDLNGYMKEVSRVFFPSNNDATLFRMVVELVLTTFNGHSMPAVFAWETYLKDAKEEYSPPTPTPSPDQEEYVKLKKDDFPAFFAEYVEENGHFLGCTTYEEYKKKLSQY